MTYVERYLWAVEQPGTLAHPYPYSQSAPKDCPWDNKQLPDLDVLRQNYVSKHGQWKDRDECKRLLQLGEHCDPMFGARAEIDTSKLLQADDFRDWSESLKTGMVIQVRFPCAFS